MKKGNYGDQHGSGQPNKGKSPSPSNSKSTIATGRAGASTSGATNSRKAVGSNSGLRASGKAIVPKEQGMMQKLERAAANNPIKKVDGMYVPEGYKMRVVKPAEKYDVVSFAKAMNDDFAPKLKELFDTETAAAIEAQKSGVYVGWRCPEFQHDCQRVFYTSRCFCDHVLSDHAQYHALSVKVPCKVPGCPCKAYQWIPNRPEDIGEFWLPKRPGFDADAWRAKCRCKHTNNFHDPNRPMRCKMKGCSCGGFNSDFLCAACDRHWEDHQTFFDSEKSRREQGLPVGTDWLPFAEMPDLRNIALTGNESDDRKYLALKQFDAIPANAVTGNDQPVKFSNSRGGGGSGPSGSGFRPVFD
ncbi:hypothetical protein EGW08_005190 [Elysia chlorotica]|uniref:Protein FAM221B n=1 Tax=Elysia chlorotica TaxID=188477 RepID=A0A3S0ZVM7_ELYCH|nr:hypothetical protein EGW08_005190 [Elysia chlorotica]